MGNGLGFRCNSCGHVFIACFGIGFCFPMEYEETAEEIRKGKYGQEWKELFESIPGAAIDAEREMYVCSSCGNSKNELNLAIYRPKEPGVSKVHNESFSVAVPVYGREYVMRYELEQDYKLVKSYVHRCPECGKRMHKYREGDILKCPECKKGRMKPNDVLMWD